MTTRRESLKLLAGFAALAGGLGMRPAEVLAGRGASADLYQWKFESLEGGRRKLLETLTLSPETSELIDTRGPDLVNLSWYRGDTLLGTYNLDSSHRLRRLG